MLFLLERIYNGALNNLGIVIADTPEAAAGKLGMEVEGFLTQSWTGMPCYHLKFHFDGAPLYMLQKLEELSEIPAKERKAFNLPEPCS